MVQSSFELYDNYRVRLFYYNPGTIRNPLKFKISCSNGNDSELYQKTYRKFGDEPESILQAMGIRRELYDIVYKDISEFSKKRSGHFYISPRSNIFYKDILTGIIYYLAGKNRMDALLYDGKEFYIYSLKHLRNKKRFIKIDKGTLCQHP